MSENAWIALALAGFGLLVLAVVVAALREAAAMRRWPVATGRVLSSRVEAYRDRAGSGASRVRMTLYRAVVLYEYEVGGRPFRGDRITQSPGLNRGAPDAAEQTVRRYAGGSVVEVRYNPERPGESVLEPRVPGSWVFALLVGVALLALAAHTYYG